MKTEATSAGTNGRGPATQASETTGACAFPASLEQSGFWFADQLDPGNPAYNIAVRWRLLGRVDPAILERAFNEIIRRHESLRTTFAVSDGELTQVVWPSLRVRMPVIDLRELRPDARASETERVTIEAGNYCFSVTSLPLIRACLLRLADDEYVLLVTVHHIVADGLSMGVIANELGRIYEAFSKAEETLLRALPVQYPDYAIWQKQWLESGAVEKISRYWEQKLRGLTPSEIIPDFPRPATRSLRGQIIGIAIPRELMTKLKGFSSRHGFTLFMTLLAALKVLLYRYTGETDIAVGTQVAGRNEETEGLVGAFVNSIVLRSDLSGDLTFAQAAERVCRTVRDALENAEMPSGRLLEMLGVARDGSRASLCGVNFTSHTAYVSDRRFAGISLIDTPPRTPGALYDLNVFLVDRPGGWRLSCQYSSDLYRPEKISALLRTFQTLLERVAEDPDQSIDTIPLLSAEEKARLTVDWNNTANSYPRERTIHGLFEEQARRKPAASALVAGGDSLSYGQLNTSANQLAHYLRQLGVSAQARVVVCLERSPEAIVARLAILKAGGAYLPLDFQDPPERLRGILRDAMPGAIVTRAAQRPFFGNCSVPIVCVDRDRGKIARESEENPTCAAAAETVACVMYTSGSTGEPKGVLVSHRGIVRLVMNADYLPIDSSDVFLLHSPLSFDASTLEIWGPLLNGGRLAIVDRSEPSLDDLDQAIRCYGVTTLWLTAGLFHLIVDERIDVLKPLRILIAGGDVLSPERVNRVLSELPGLRLMNGYGPTENTTFTCCYDVPRTARPRGSVPIGKPISNTQVYILDGHRSPVPVGMPGELYIGGDGLALGYLNCPELTRSKFVPHPFSEDSKARLYRSGDLARYRTDGNIEFLGRLDNQIKINGYRVESGEVESVLLRHLQVAEAAVVVHKGDSGRKRLAAYVVAARTCRISTTELIHELTDYLRNELPRYMQPAAIVRLSKLPLTKTGKVDRAELRGSERPLVAKVHTDFRDELERQVAALWQEVLGVPTVGPKDDFFALGGDSLTALRLFARISRGFGMKLPLATLFRAPTVAQLADILRGHEAPSPLASLVAIRAGGSGPPLYLVAPLGGNALRFHELAGLLPAGWRVYALEPPGLDRPQPHLTSMEAMAAHYIRQLKGNQADGPYYLAGYSFGGLVAFEMARQLSEAGDRVALLALLDPPTWESYSIDIVTGPLPERFKRYWQRLSRFMFRPRRVRYLFTGMRRRALWWVYKLFNALQRPLPQWLGTVRDVNEFAAAHYVPHPYSGLVTLFHTTDASMQEIEAYERSWGELARGGLAVEEIPGDHDGIMMAPAVRVLADRLGDRLEGARAGVASVPAGAELAIGRSHAAGLG